ncbi:2-C-methyl-D-erythritol 4-phosphate cytidylyltransferase [Undibacterium flavidum]|uniref:2-C-methyl-D-erythritol 4-phosphate cytidylyltransferase n=1 Tax=Undibacterium flavidum TaxID=2762297 RepID=A0ABR6YFP2_9BURK|nr:2-C-methyl-D-erythritol 4-phosphate cytidylyltransferase [Undibacterium flavidum]MBC3875348.1 2-C-methyl-D-erythritol 4-phosphate cytidylyltransferase [Undibacterium flavidum]
MTQQSSDLSILPRDENGDSSKDLAPKYIALIPAAGVGARMAANVPKQYLDLAGKSVLQRTVDCFLACPQIDHIFVVVSAEDAFIDEALAANNKLTVLNCGGATRRDTVQNGLQVISKFSHYQNHDQVLVHDAARPGLTPVLVGKLIDAIGNDVNGGLLALPVVDTVKRSVAGQVETIDRLNLWLAQTPQLFSLGLLSRALEMAIEVTDEASAIEAIGYHPKLVEGALRNCKLTVPEDLEFLKLFF